MPRGSDPMPPGDPSERSTPANEHSKPANAHEPTNGPRQTAVEPALSAERLRKPDGRLLILYHWDGGDG